MKKLVNKIKRFKNDENGMEFIQVGVIVLGVMLLVAAVWLIYNKINSELVEVPSQIHLTDGVG